MDFPRLAGVENGSKPEKSEKMEQKSDLLDEIFAILSVEETQRQNRENVLHCESDTEVGSDETKDVAL